MRDKIEFLRADLMRVACANNKGHIASSLSCLEILAVLRYSIMGPDDVLILSKGHGCYGLYAIDADQGRISRDVWENWRLPGTYDGLGALGHGLPLGAGEAFGRMLQGLPGHVFVIVGDGELQEGSNWEALAFIRHHGLVNVTVIVDDNGLQAIEPTDFVLHSNLAPRFHGWGFATWAFDGHDIDSIVGAWESDSQVWLARTVKGRGFPAMENVAKFHYRVPTIEERQPCK
jgi:transketolase